MYDAFAQELEKVAKAGKDPALEALLRHEKAQDELKDLQAAGKKGAYVKGVAIGAGIAASMPAMLMMAPWMSAREARAADVNSAMQKRYIAAELATQPNISKAVAMQEAGEIVDYMKSVPDSWRRVKPGIDTAREKAWKLTDVPTHAGAKQTAIKGAVKETGVHTMIGRSLDDLTSGGAWRGHPATAAAVEKRYPEILRQLRKVHPMDTAPSLKEWDKLMVSLKTKYQGKVGTSGNREFLKVLGKQMRNVGKAAVPFALIGGIGGAVSVSKKRKMLAKIRKGK